jgi:hypothetical protein
VSTASLGHSAAIRIIRRAGRNWQHAGAGDGDLVVSGSGGGLGCGGNTSEDEKGNEGADDEFHNGIPLKCYLTKKICLDNKIEVTLGYKLE